MVNGIECIALEERLKLPYRGILLLGGENWRAS